MTQCIGRIGGGYEDWFAELDFDEMEAVVCRRGKDGRTIGPIATVPMGMIYPESDDYDASLCDDEQNRNLMLIVFAPEIVRNLREMRGEISRGIEHFNRGLCPQATSDRANIARVVECAEDAVEMLAQIVDDINECLDLIRVPTDGINEKEAKP